MIWTLANFTRWLLYGAAMAVLCWCLYRYDTVSVFLMLLACCGVEWANGFDQAARIEARAQELAQGAIKADRDFFSRKIDHIDLTHANRVEALAFEKGALAQKLEEKKHRQLRANAQHRVGGRFAVTDEAMAMQEVRIVLDNRAE